MGVDQRLAAVQFLHDRQEQRVPKPLVAVARHQGDAVGLERIERIGQFTQAAFGVDERQHGEIAKPSGIIRDQFCGILIRLAAELSRRIALGEIDGGRGDGQHRGGNAGLIHVGQRFLDGPVLHQRIAKTAVVRRGHVGRRRQMMVNVNPERFCVGGLRRCPVAPHGR